MTQSQQPPAPGLGSTLTRLAALRLMPASVGLLIIVALTTYDLGHDDRSIVVGTVVLGAFVTAAFGDRRQTILVAAVAVGCVVLSGFWHDNLFDTAFAVRLVVVVGGGITAVIAAAERERHLEIARRFGVLSAMAKMVDHGSLNVGETAARLADILVPAVADNCVFDVLIDGELRRVAVRVTNPDSAELEPRVRARPLSPAATGTGTSAITARNEPQLLQGLDAQGLAHAYDAADRELLERLDQRSSAIVPLRGRGRVLGALALSVTGVSGRRYRKRDLDFFEVLAGRAALALDNSGLDSDLRDAERQLGIALGALDDAVTVMGLDGRTLYANRAALAMLGVDDPSELYAAQPGDLMARYDVFDEDGQRVSIDELPMRALMNGERDVPPKLVRNIVRATGEERWLLHKVSPITDAEGALARIVNVVEDVTIMKRAELRSRLLSEASEILASSLDYEQTLQRVAELAVPDLADWCGVAIPDDRGFIRTVAVAHMDPERVQFARDMGERYPEPADAPTGAAAVIRSGIPEVVNDIPDELLAQVARDPEHLALLRGAGLRAALTVPMFTGGGIVGALSLVSAESGRTFSGDDVDLAQELARRAGTAVENARLFTERERITAALQDGLRPSALPDVPGWTAAALYRPAGALDEVGGDFYDLFQTPGGWMLVVGDVTGHGAAAARLTAVARFALRAVVELSGNPIAALQQLNRMLLAEPELSLVTLVCAVLGPRIGDAASVDIIRCGHPAPLLVRPGDVEEIGEANPIVGAFPDAAWQATRVAMRAGETLLLYTDGVTDASGADERFGTERLLDSVRAQQTGAPQDLIAGVARVLTEFRVGAQRDDEALVALQLDEDPAALGPDTPLGIVTTRDGRDA